VSPDPSKLLVIDDELNRGDDTLSRRLAGQGYAVEVAKNSLEALEKIRRARYDLVVLDQMTPGLDGGATQLDLLRLLRATYSTSDLPVIVVTAADGDSATARDSIDNALRNGASDYLIQPLNLPEVAARIETQLSRAKTEQHLRFLDPLTGLGNRAALLARLNDLISLSPSADRGRAALVRVDLDGFERLNDSLGDSAGDDLLREAARRVQEAVQSVAWGEPFRVARIGGDEFAVAGPCEDRRQLDEVAATILQHLNRPLVVRGA
jgi:diguanylate cyclase (GGDEF)-like protein